MHSLQAHCFGHDLRTLSYPRQRRETNAPIAVTASMHAAIAVTNAEVSELTPGTLAYWLSANTPSKPARSTMRTRLDRGPTWPSSSPPRPQPRHSCCHQLARQEFVRTTGRSRPIETDTTSKPTLPAARTSRSLESVGVQAPQTKNRYECSNSRRRPSARASSVG